MPFAGSRAGLAHPNRFEPVIRTTPEKPCLVCRDVRAEYCSEWQSVVVDDLSTLARMKIFPLERGSDWIQSVTLEAGGKLAPSRRVMVYLSPVPSL
jgi:hypothetical protein